MNESGMGSHFGPSLSSVLLRRPGLTPGCRGPGLPALTGMELGPLREEALLPPPSGAVEAPLREEGGSVALGDFTHETGKMNTKQTIA